jgi:nitric oxide reductase subunit B
MMISNRVRIVLLLVLVLTFAVLIGGGYLINREKPPIPARVLSENGTVLFTDSDMMAGQRYYFSRGGMHIGTIWGHGSYLAPDWSADYLHRSGLYAAARYQRLAPDRAARFSQKDFDSLDAIMQAAIKAHVIQEFKTNRYDPAKNELIYTANQTEAFSRLISYYTSLFKNGNDRMGLQPGIVRTDHEGFIIASFFSWLSWAAVTNRPGQNVTYTTNWPYDPLVGNEPAPDAVIWSIVSVILLILAIGLLVFLYQRYIKYDSGAKLITNIQNPKPSLSQKATIPLFAVAMLLFLAQIGAGGLTAHFTVEGTSFFGLPISKILPYAVLRTWHLQLGIFWIATCFLASGLFMAPFVGHEPKNQGKLVILLFGAVTVVVVGALAGNWLSVMGFLENMSYYLGHQGYEYIELGRVWQILLIAGMLLWLVLVVRAIKPALKAEHDKGGLTHLFLYTSIAIPLFYMAGLLYGRESHLSVAEYWRWWVVHLWVEGFFEAFATVSLAFILTRIGAVTQRFALTIAYLNITLYLGSGVIGTFHHLYWTGTPAPIIALGAVFSALEVVPLTFLGFEAANNIKVIAKGTKTFVYRWPLYFFISVAFWNLVGAGVFGFLINPPIILYYIQGMNTTPLHAHTALFGVYGLLAIALMLFSLRHIVQKDSWSDELLKWSFWGLNGGLLSMTLFTFLPAGFYQFYYGVKYGMWYARSPEVTSSEFIRIVSWIRMGSDIIFAIGAFLLLAFVARAIWMSFLKKLIRVR